MRGPGTEELCTEVAEPYFGRISKLILQSTFYIVREKKKSKGCVSVIVKRMSRSFLHTIGFVVVRGEHVRPTPLLAWVVIVSR